MIKELCVVNESRARRESFLVENGGDAKGHRCVDYLCYPPRWFVLSGVRETRVFFSKNVSGTN